MTPFPHRYTVTLSNRQLLAPPREPIALGPPPQFGGSDRVWSPEELLVGATLECLWTTFEAFAKRDVLNVIEWSGTGVAILDRGARVPVFTSITLSVELHVAIADEDRARRILEKAEKSCIISNALNVPVKLEMTVSSSPSGSVGTTQVLEELLR
jgi:organic hydroperoxide reductase OsmC/OhrA